MTSPNGRIEGKTNDFNSYPHKEDDYGNGCNPDRWNISTHIPTRRMTDNSKKTRYNMHISTHIPTRRMTGMVRKWLSARNISTHIPTRRMTKSIHGQEGGFDISTHIPTRRMTAYVRYYLRTILNFNSHPHKEDDRKVG